MIISYMTYEKSDAVKQARMSLIQQALGEIFNGSDHNEFSRKAFYVIAKLGLQLPAEEEGLFTNENRANPELSQDELKTRLKEFIFKYIK